MVLEIYLSIENFPVGSLVKISLICKVQRTSNKKMLEKI